MNLHALSTPRNRYQLAAALASLLITLSPTLADVVVVESRSGGKNFAAYAEGSGNWANSTAKSSAADLTSGVGSRFETADGGSFRVTPTLANAGGTYLVEVTHGVSSSIPTDLQVGIGVTGGTGLPATTTSFNQTPANVWRSVGTIVLDSGVNNPTITFTKQAGATGTGQRFYADAVRFTDASDPCLNFPAIVTVNGPLAAGQTFVDVPTVDSTAIAVTVYADGVQIGQKAAGITAGVNRVTTSALVKGQIIAATQTSPTSVESCRPSTGPKVGGGANPRVRISLSIRQNAGLTGPIGANGGTSDSIIKFLGATNTFGGGFAAAPVGGKVIQPETCWQTVTFLRGEDPNNPVDKSYRWTGTDGTHNLLGNFGVLDSIAFAIDDLTDSGPFNLYIDSFMNGDTLIQGFEGGTNGQNSVFLAQPSLSGTTSPFLLAQSPGAISPNVSQVTTAFADEGSNAARVSWQFKDSAGLDWLRCAAQGSGTPNPQLDLRLPITFRILLLPPGVVSLPLKINTHPADRSAVQGTSASFSVNVCGTPPFSYQWHFNGINVITDATNRTLTLNNVSPANGGAYHVVVTDASGSTNSNPATLTVSPATFTNCLAELWRLAPGSRPYLNTDGSQRSIAYHPVTGNLLLVSRAGGSNAVYVLDGNTGADLWTLTVDTNVVTGGTFAMNMIGVDDVGGVFVGNLTTNGSTDEFRLYGWIDDSAEALPYLAWHGNPGGVDYTNRWGDTMSVRGSGAGVRVLLGGRPDPVVSILDPSVDPNSLPLPILVGDANPGDFSHGIAWGAGETFWGKGIGASNVLKHVAFDPNTASGTTLQTFASLPNVAPIGVDTARNLLAGVSIETPDNLRLYSVANLAAEPVNLDTRFFPTDNANGNRSGAVAFAPGRVYALDANNGIIAFGIRPALRYTRTESTLTLSWDAPAVLQSSTHVEGVYSDLLDQSSLPVTSPYAVDTAAGTQTFFRLRQ